MTNLNIYPDNCKGNFIEVVERRKKGSQNIRLITECCYNCGSIIYMKSTGIFVGIFGGLSVNKNEVKVHSRSGNMHILPLDKVMVVKASDYYRKVDTTIYTT